MEKGKVEFDVEFTDRGDGLETWVAFRKDAKASRRILGYGFLLRNVGTACWCDGFLLSDRLMTPDPWFHYTQLSDSRDESLAKLTETVDVEWNPPPKSASWGSQGGKH